MTAEDRNLPHSYDSAQTRKKYKDGEPTASHINQKESQRSLNSSRIHIRFMKNLY